MTEEFDQLADVHAVGEDFVMTKSGLALPKPDQGYRCVWLRLDMPGSTGLVAWEGKEGDDLDGFMARWAQWIAGDEELLPFLEPRFGFRHYFPRSLIPRVIEIGYCYLPRHDVRAEAQQEAVGAVELVVPEQVAANLIRRSQAHHQQQLRRRRLN